MKNIWNDPRSLFNGNHFSSYYFMRCDYITNLNDWTPLNVFEGAHPQRLLINIKVAIIYIYLYHGCCGNSHGIKVIYPA